MPCGRAVDDRDRRAPVALAADQPVAQAVGDRRLALALLLQRGDDPPSALVGRQPAELAAVDQHLVVRVRDVAPRRDRRPRSPGARDDPADRQPELLRELVVALVVGRDGHDRAGAVAGEDVVGDEDRDPLAVDRVDRVGADRRRRSSRDRSTAARSRSRSAARATYASTSARRSGAVSAATSGCSGARTMNVAPNSVSGRVVKTRSSSPPGVVGGRRGRRTRSRRPRTGRSSSSAWIRIGSGKSIPLKSSSSSAYFVTRRYHWSRSRFSTFAPQRQQWRSAPSTCSRASVPSFGHQSTGRLRAVGQAGLQELQEEPLVPAVVVGVAGDDLGAPVERRAHRAAAGGACCRCSTSSSRAG